MAVLHEIYPLIRRLRDSDEELRDATFNLPVSEVHQLLVALQPLVADTLADELTPRRTESANGEARGRDWKDNLQLLSPLLDGHLKMLALSNKLRKLLLKLLSFLFYPLQRRLLLLLLLFAIAALAFVFTFIALFPVGPVRNVSAIITSLFSSRSLTPP